MEVEPPWMELTSEYPLKENMTFQVDTFLYTEEYGLRWEDAVRVTKNGVEKILHQMGRVSRTCLLI
jgi:Xaa-Pro aminopeptidase